MLDDLNVNTLNRYPLRAAVLALAADSATPQELYALFRDSGRGDEGQLRRLAGRMEPRLLVLLARALGHDSAASWAGEQMARLGVWNGAPEPLLMGRHLLELGLAPGPRVGSVARAVYELQLDGLVTSLEEALEAARAVMGPVDARRS
jgi:tRNA nucleotidyltransferase (CCA-adding enzyme)